jgi:hypothetical protein
MPRLRQITHSLLDDALGKNGGLGHVDVVKSSPATSLRTIQIGMIRPIREDHTKFLQVAIKTHSFILEISQDLE